MLLVELDFVVGRRYPAHPVDEGQGIRARLLPQGQFADGQLSSSAMLKRGGSKLQRSCAFSSS